MKMFFYRFETQPAFIGNLLVAVPIAHQTHQTSFSVRKPGQMRQGSAASLISLCAALAQILELDKKLRPRDSGRANLFQTDSRAKVVQRRMPNCLVFEMDRRNAKRTQLFPSLLEDATLIKDLRWKRRLQFDNARTRRSPLPYSTKLACSLISIDHSQIPSQQNCWQRDSAHKLFKGHSHDPFALE